MTERELIWCTAISVLYVMAVVTTLGQLSVLFTQWDSHEDARFIWSFFSFMRLVGISLPFIVMFSMQ